MTVARATAAAASNVLEASLDAKAVVKPDFDEVAA